MRVESPEPDKFSHDWYNLWDGRLPEIKQMQLFRLAPMLSEAEVNFGLLPSDGKRLEPAGKTTLKEEYSK